MFIEARATVNEGPQSRARRLHHEFFLHGDHFSDAFWNFFDRRFAFDVDDDGPLG